MLGKGAGGIIKQTFIIFAKKKTGTITDAYYGQPKVFERKKINKVQIIMNSSIIIILYNTNTFNTEGGEGLTSYEISSMSSSSIIP